MTRADGDEGSRKRARKAAAAIQRWTDEEEAQLRAAVAEQAPHGIA